MSGKGTGGAITIHRGRFDRQCGRVAAHAAASRSEGETITGVQTRRSTIIFLISAIALAGFNPFGQDWVQFMIV